MNNKEIKQNKLKYQAQYYNLYNVNTINSHYKTAQDYLVYPIHQILSDSYADIILANKIKLDSENEDLKDMLNTVLFDIQDLHNKLYSLIVESSATGNAFLEIKIKNFNSEDETNKQSVELLLHDTENVKIVEQMFSDNNIIEKYVLTKNIIYNKKDYILYKEFYRNTNEYLLFEKDKQISIEEITELLEQLQITRIDNLTAVFEHNLNDFLILNLKNTSFGENKSNIGISDYTLALDTHVKKYNTSLNEVSNVLYHHTYPKLMIASVTLNKIKKRYEVMKETTSAQKELTIDEFIKDTEINSIAKMDAISQEELEYILKDIKILESGQFGDNKAEYLTWDGNLEAQFKYQDRILDNMLSIINIPKLAIQSSSEIGNLSGVAIGKLFSKFLSKANRKAIVINRFLNNLLYISAKIIMKQNNLETTVKANINVSIKDSKDAIVTLYTNLLDHRLVTREKAIANIFDYDSVQAEKLIEEIEIEDAKSLEMTTLNEPKNNINQ